MLRKFFTVLFLIASINFIADEKKNYDVTDYLVLGPIEVNMPLGSTDNDMKSFLTEDQLTVVDWWPSAGDQVSVFSNQKLKWKNSKGSELSFSKGDKPTIYYVGFYVKVDRFTEVNLESKTCHLVKLFFNGAKKNEKTSFTEEGKCDEGKISSELELENGKHFVLAKILFDPSKDVEWTFSTSLSSEFDLNISTSPQRYTTVSDLLDNKKVSSISLSPDGAYVALGFKERNKVKNEFENWIQIHRVPDGTLVWTFRGEMSIPEVDWAPDSRYFAYTSASGEAKTLWLVNGKTGESEPLLQEVKNLSGFEWAPNGEFIVYTTTEEVKSDDPNFKKYELPEDRWPGFRNKTSLHRVFIESKMTEQLTVADQSFGFGEISPDSKKILFTKSYYAQDKRPYFRSDYHILDLNKMKADSVLSLFYSTSASWAPDSKRLLILGGVTTFGDAGNPLDKEIIPNDYDTQAYIYDLETKEVKPVTKNFNPQINSAEWDGVHNVIYFTTTDQSYNRLYKYDIAKTSFELIDLGIESLDKIDFAKDFSVAVFKGSSSNVTEKTYKLDLPDGKVNLLIDPEEAEYSDIVLGDVKDWDFTSSAGQKIKGRIYFPPNFDKEKKYPAIVNYYAGTSPTTREFEGRYPKNYWTANGYVIYVLQPSGATGFGSEFAAKHVNDWGTITAQEIIEGTKKFLEEHEFVDPERVGCIGASYGGFETMSLITKTDIFSAAISHAGISNLTSYWGIGFWGYWYNSIAAAESFPWNRKDVYVDKSPIFNADKVNTPLLLLHGNTDPNVPPGESMQMYVALKHLGKDVELIEVDKQEHWILQYEKRTKWSKTILAYYDKYLKDQPEWWNSLYK